jgi:tetratricopeptide (TPR) repeat protein
MSIGCEDALCYAVTPLARAYDRGVGFESQKHMASVQDIYDEAMFAFSRGDYDGAVAQLRSLLAEEPAHFDAQLALGMAFYRKGDYAAAIAEGKKAEALKPREQLAHTNLSLFYMKSGDRATAEHHGLQARIASWREGSQTGELPDSGDPELQLARPKLEPVKLPAKFPDMPWKKKAPISSPKEGGQSTSGAGGS